MLADSLIIPGEGQVYLCILPARPVTALGIHTSYSPHGCLMAGCASMFIIPISAPCQGMPDRSVLQHLLLMVLQPADGTFLVFCD